MINATNYHRDANFKTIMKCHFKPIRMMLSINQQEQVLVKMWEKGNPCELLVGIQIDAATVENSMKLCEKIRNATAL